MCGNRPPSASSTVSDNEATIFRTSHALVFIPKPSPSKDWDKPFKAKVKILALPNKSTATAFQVTVQNMDDVGFALDFPVTYHIKWENMGEPLTMTVKDSGSPMLPGGIKFGIKFLKEDSMKSMKHKKRNR
jgi:hypothetical protein